MPLSGDAPSIYDIGWGLARTARFAGQTKLWYSVLPHVYSVAAIVTPEAKIHALLHDAAESVVGDQVSTWKNRLTEDSESEVLDSIYRSIGLNPLSRDSFYSEIHAADIVCRAAEARALGHADPSLFDIPNKSLYSRAVEATAVNIARYRPMRCILATDSLAKEFVEVLNTEIKVEIT